MSAKQGFFFMEFLVVLALIIIIIALAIPNLSLLTHAVLKSEVDKLTLFCYYLRQCALATNTEQKLIFNKINNSYTIQTVTHSFSKALQFGFLPNCYGPPSQPLYKINYPITFPHDMIRFFPDGSMSSGTIYLIDATKQNGYAITIPSAQFPHIRKYVYQDRWVLMP